jgi:hypothetical protein
MWPQEWPRGLGHWKPGAWHYKSKILGVRIVFLKQVPLYRCRPVIHLHAHRHYVQPLGLHAGGDCYWPSLTLWDETPIGGPCVIYPIIFRQKWIYFMWLFSLFQLG